MRARPILLLCLLIACDFSAATKVDAGDSGAVDSGAPGGDEGGAGGGGGGSGGTGGAGGGPDPLDVDDDEDGFTEREGDCDDADPGISPGQVDGCDGEDEDCDGDVDEDAVDEDPYEPNDTAGVDLGSLSDDPAHNIEAALHDDGDVDRFVFDLVDGGWSLFRLDVGLSNIPEDAVYRLRLRNLSSGQTVYDESGSGALSVRVDDTVLQDDAGTWEVEVSSLGGADCGRRYLLSVGFSD